ncbi:MAG: FkbM family methyltransferase [Bacteroidota bacterium]|nr:FkbM family methyltransferase [Bacteroidota bacterium]
MLVKIDYLIRKYRLKVTGILHLGAHECEEALDYSKSGIDNVTWVEANPVLFKKIKQKWASNEKYTFIEAAIFDVNGKELQFNISNNTQASSLLEFDKHSQYHPDMVMTQTITVQTQTLDKLNETYHFDSKKCNFLNIDLQGVELNALKGFENGLNFIDYIFTEVNFEPLYKGCALIGEIDDFLKQKGFQRVLTVKTEQNFGDALYIKNANSKYLPGIVLSYDDAMLLRKGFWSKVWRKIKSNAFPKRQK